MAPSKWYVVLSRAGHLSALRKLSVEQIPTDNVLYHPLTIGEVGLLFADENETKGFQVGQFYTAEEADQILSKTIEPFSVLTT